MAAISGRAALTRIQALRKIVAECQHAKVEGFTVDLFTADVMVQVFDKLNPESQAKFGDVPFLRLVDFCLSKVQ